MRIPAGGQLIEYVAIRFPESCHVEDVAGIVERYRLEVLVNGVKIAEENLSHIHQARDGRFIFHIHFRVKAGDNVSARLEAHGEPFVVRRALDIEAELSILGSIFHRHVRVVVWA